MAVPYLDLKRQHAALAEEIMADVREILADAWFVGGKHIAAFEEEFARRCGTRYAVALNSGTTACRFAMAATGLGHGGAIVTTPNTFFATCEAAHHLGARVRFADVDPVTFNMDPDSLDSCLEDDVTHVVPVHLYGLPCDMRRITETAEKKGLTVVEDACQSHFARFEGRTVGSFGAAAAFSFYPSKNLGAIGDAGAAVTSDEETARRMRLLRDHGQTAKYVHELFGDNGRMAAIQAAALNAKMKRIDEWTEKRRKVAAMYRERLADAQGVGFQQVPADRTHVYYMFVITHPERDSIAEEFDKSGIGYAFKGVKPLHLQPVFAGRYARGDFPNVERLMDEMLALPIFPEMTEAQVEEVCAAVRRVTG